MNIILIAISVLILTFGVVNSKNFNKPESTDNIQGISDSAYESNDNSDSENKDILPTSEEQKVTATQTPPPSTPIPTNAPVFSNLNSYKYSNSKVISTTSNTLVLESEDSVEVITNWYKNLIESNGFNVKSFVETKANDKVLNKLVGAKNSEQVEVEISKEKSNTVNIIITLK